MERATCRPSGPDLDPICRLWCDVECLTMPGSHHCPALMRAACSLSIAFESRPFTPAPFPFRLKTKTTTISTDATRPRPSSFQCFGLIRTRRSYPFRPFILLTRLAGQKQQTCFISNDPIAFCFVNTGHARPSERV